MFIQKLCFNALYPSDENFILSREYTVKEFYITVNTIRMLMRKTPLSLQQIGFFWKMKPKYGSIVKRDYCYGVSQAACIDK